MVIFSNERAAGATTIAEESMVPPEVKIYPQKLFYHFYRFFLILAIFSIILSLVLPIYF
jgi:hypothetical protein